MVYNSTAAASSSQSTTQPSSVPYSTLQQTSIRLKDQTWIPCVELQRPTPCTKLLSLVLRVGSIAAGTIAMKVMEQLGSNRSIQFTVKGEAEETIKNAATDYSQGMRTNLAYLGFPPEQINLILSSAEVLPREYFEGKQLTITQQDRDSLHDKLCQVDLDFYLFCMKRINCIRLIRDAYTQTDITFLGGAPAISFRNLSSFQYALLSIQEVRAEESDSDLASTILEKLRSWGYRISLEPQVGNLVLYYHLSSVDSVHMGRVNERWLVESKFRGLPAVYEHELFAVPNTHGDRVIFLRK